VHAIAIDVTSEDRAIPEGALSAPNATPPDLEIGANSFFRHSWLPPDPPPGHGEHRYVFQVFALRQGPPFSKTAGRREFIDRILDRAIAVGCLIGTYERGSIRKSGDEALVEQQPESIAIPAYGLSPLGPCAQLLRRPAGGIRGFRFGLSGVEMVPI
jgi:hypothetical protein